MDSMPEKKTRSWTARSPSISPFAERIPTMTIPDNSDTVIMTAIIVRRSGLFIVGGIIQ